METGDRTARTVFENEEQIEEALSRPSAETVVALTRLDGDLGMGWVAAGGRTLGKPTKFQVRDGRF